MRIDGGFALRAAALVFVATGLLLLATLLPASDAPPASSSVTEPTLANGEIMLRPSDVKPRIGRHQAEQIAQDQFFGANAPKVLESWLGHYEGTPGSFDGTVWVVALNPDDVPASVSGPAPRPGQPPRERPEYRTTRATAVIDAVSGEAVLSSTVASPVDPPPASTPPAVLFSP